VTLSGTDNSTIGGTLPKARNLISGNEAAGVEVGSGSGNKIQGNLIGTDKNGTADLGNGAWGVAAYSPSNTIGDSDPTDGATNAANTIAFNGNDGVNVFNGTGNRILSNSIFSNGGGFNGGLGIDLSGQTEDANGVTPNDPDDPTTSKPDPDKDTGPNGLQNYPLINSATTTPIGTAINGTLNSTPSTRKKSTFTIQFFSNPAADSPSGYGEGQTYLGQTQVTTDRQGNASFGFAPAQPVSVGRYITATATNTKTGGTSEFSQARVVVEPGFEQ